MSPSGFRAVCDAVFSTRPGVAGAAHNRRGLVLALRKAAGIAQTRVVCVCVYREPLLFIGFEKYVNSLYIVVRFKQHTKLLVS